MGRKGWRQLIPVKESAAKEIKIIQYIVQDTAIYKKFQILKLHKYKIRGWRNENWMAGIGSCREYESIGKWK